MNILKIQDWRLFLFWFVAKNIKMSLMKIYQKESKSEVTAIQFTSKSFNQSTDCFWKHFFYAALDLH